MTYVQDPDAVLDYPIDWQGGDKPFLASGETISASTWTVPAGLTRVSATSDDTTATVWLAGGTVGEVYRVTNHIVTSAGRENDQSFDVRIAER